eukprot:scaffold91813_cov45-Phaeocystis_antarctica.AAC.1
MRAGKAERLVVLATGSWNPPCMRIPTLATQYVLQGPDPAARPRPAPHLRSIAWHGTLDRNWP